MMNYNDSGSTTREVIKDEEDGDVYHARNIWKGKTLKAVHFEIFSVSFEVVFKIVPYSTHNKHPDSIS